MARIFLFSIFCLFVLFPFGTQAADSPGIAAEPHALLGAPSPEHPIATQPPTESSRPDETGRLPSVRVRVSAASHTILSSQMSGRITDVAVRDGERFLKGDVLVRLDNDILQLQLARSQAAFRRQEIVYDMTKELAGFGTKGDAEVEVLEMEMEQARSELESVKALLSRSIVRSPFIGRVADVFVQENQYVAEGQPLVEILDDSTLELEFIVSSLWVRWFTPGYAFQVTIDETGATYDAVLDRIGGKVDPLSQSVKAYATFANPAPNLMEGMSGAAAILPPKGESL